MSEKTERMNENLIDGFESDVSENNTNTQVRYSVLQEPWNKSKRPFCSGPFKVASVCLAATCLLLLVILVVTNVHIKGSGQDLQPGSAETQTSDLSAELETLRKNNSDLEREISQLRDRIAMLERTVSTQTTPKSCTDDWLYFNSSCYFISTNMMSWKNSQSYCKSQGGHLAIIHTPEEQTFIWDLLPPGHWNSYWFGISDEKVEDDWYWVDGTKLVGGFWEVGEPNNHINEDCGYILKTDVPSRVATKSWYDAPCGMSLPWICERDGSP